MTDNSQNLMVFENVGIRYGIEKEIIRDINLTIRKGDFIFLIGESGVGKSSLLNLMHLGLSPSRGFLNILNNDVYNLHTNQISLLRRQIGFIFQDFRLINHLSVFDNVALPLKISNTPTEEIKDRVYDTLKWIKLEKYAKMSPLHLSGGEQQRVSVARAIINKPKIILADEPTGSVDPILAKKILLTLEELNNQGTAVVFATHNFDLLENSNHPIALIQDSKLSIVR